MKIIYVHCGEETNLRDFRSQKDQIRFPNLKEIIYAAVSQLEPKLVTYMDRCLPLKTVTMSSRDPALMSPLVKSLQKKKSRLSCNNKDQLAIINRRISELICENRKYLAAPVGSGGWWKTIDDITQRRTHLLY